MLRVYLKSLLEEHRNLDRMIDSEAKLPAPWSPKLQKMKRARVALKDRIASLKRNSRIYRPDSR